ncbi:hypothetical protein M885DRAFT_435802, partial [Pelagophyceae sp. CCMP2097]
MRVVSFLAWLAASAHDLPYVSPECPRSARLLRAGPVKTAIITLWIEEQPHDRLLLPRDFRISAQARLSAFACAVRAVTDQPAFAALANVSPAFQRAACDAKLHVLDVSDFDTKPFWLPVTPEKALREKMWFNHTTNDPPQARTDGWKTRYKFLLFNLTRIAHQFVYLDLDVVLLADPMPFAKTHSARPLVSAFECGKRGYVGMHASVMLFRPDAEVFRQLFQKSKTHDYLANTNGDQDIQESFWCPTIAGLPKAEKWGACETKARLDAPFSLRFQGPTRPLFL